MENKKFYHDIFWIILRRLVTRIINFISTVILARLLVPADFGLFGFAIVVINFLLLFKDLGTSAADIYHDAPPRLLAGTMLSLNLLVGVVRFFICQLIAPLVGHFFCDPRAGLFLRVLSLSFIFVALANPQESLLRKELHFRRLVLVQIIACFAAGVLAVLSAWLGAGAWSLVNRNLLTLLLSTCLLWLVSPWRIRLAYNKEIAKKLLRYGFYIQLGLLVGFISLNVDYLVIGRILGKGNLGLYLLAFNSCFLILGIFSLVTHQVMFPVFAKQKNNRLLLNERILQGFQFISLLVVPAGCGLALVARSFTLTFYGAKWQLMVVRFIFLAGYAALRSLMAVFFEGMRALGIVRLLVVIALIKLVILVPVLIFAARYGIAAVAATHLAFGIIGVIIDLFIIKKVLNINSKDILTRLTAPALSTGIMVSGILLLRLVWRGTTPFVNLVSEICCGILLYLLGLKLFHLDKNFLKKLWNTIFLKSQ